MVDSSASPVALETYRERADRFEAEMLEEYYLHFAGLKDTLEIEPIYARYEDLTTLDVAKGSTVESSTSK